MQRHAGEKYGKCSGAGAREEAEFKVAHYTGLARAVKSQYV